MSIVGINNRTENWKTAYELAPFFRDGSACAKLARTLDEGDSPTGNEVKIELFWKGMRDYADKIEESEKDILKANCATVYRELFPDLHDEIKKFSERARNTGSRGLLQTPKDKNYAVPESDNIDGLWDNLFNTEIDIVLETPHSLFIGEAKAEAGLDAKGGYVLVHQLIRQYVTARILLHVMGSRKGVVPFLVVADADYIGRTGQVQFMISQEWLKKENVLTWGDIRGLQP